MRVELAPAFILHTRPFKDSSLILDCLSHQYGLISLIAKGAKKPRSRLVGKIQPFILLSLSWLGKSELKTLIDLETQNLSPLLGGAKIMLGFYLNELILRLLQKMDPHPQLFEDYAIALKRLAEAKSKTEEEAYLRYFEIKLLGELGYGLDLQHDAVSHQPIFADLIYAYDPLVGLFEAHGLERTKHAIVVSGATLIALREESLLQEHEQKEAKLLMRFVLNYHLGDKPLQSRKLFRKVTA